MRLSTATSPHIFSRSSLPQLMRRVLYAMLPGLAVQTWLFGWGLPINVIVASVVALAAEAVVLLSRGKSLSLHLGDGSALVTAWLLAAALPALAPWWLTAVGVSFAIVVAKHLYGGLGYNPFNPAMVGYVVLLISFPREMTTWPDLQQHLSFGDAAGLILSGSLPAGRSLDAVTGATPLDTLKTQLAMGKSVAEITGNGLLNGAVGRGWEWVSLAYLLGGLWLLHNRTAAWQIPAGMLGGLALLAGLLHALDPRVWSSAWFHVSAVSSIYGAFFIATDPVSASTTPWGRVVYGAGIGFLVYLIRVFGGYPDGVAFAVLLMNMTVPTLDYYTQPRVFGAHRG
jgi:electron transport complex protein RnfD